MDGIIYGAAAGMGFAALENLIYGLNRLDALSHLLATISVRTLAAPFAHGMWTAIICAAIWQVKGAGRPRFGWPILAGLAVSVALHALWDLPLPPAAGSWYVAWLVLLGLAGLLLLARLLRSATSEQKVAALALNPELALGSSVGRARLHCRHCSQMAPAGSHYCIRCGLALSAA
jgi:protease PrsW